MVLDRNALRTLLDVPGTLHSPDRSINFPTQHANADFHASRWSGSALWRAQLPRSSSWWPGWMRRRRWRRPSPRAGQSSWSARTPLWVSPGAGRGSTLAARAQRLLPSVARWQGRNLDRTMALGEANMLNEPQVGCYIYILISFRARMPPRFLAGSSSGTRRGGSSGDGGGPSRSQMVSIVSYDGPSGGTGAGGGARGGASGRGGYGGGHSGAGSGGSDYSYITVDYGSIAGSYGGGVVLSSNV